MDLREATRAALWRTVEAGRASAESAFTLGATLDACERLGLLPEDELAAWRALARSGIVPAPAADPDAPRRHLERLLAGVTSISDDPGPEAYRAQQRFDAALGALRDVGLVDEDEWRAWRERSLRAAFPSHDDGQVFAAVSGDASAFATPPPDEEALRAEAEAAAEAVGDPEQVLIVRDPASADGFVVLAAVCRPSGVDLLFHALDEQAPDPEDPMGHERFSAFLEGLPRPELSDEHGTRYEAELGVSGGGNGRSFAGVRRYTPAAPPGVEALVARVGGTTWRLGSGRARST